MVPKLLKYQEIQGWLIQELSGGKFAIGDKFHSENELARKFEVTPVTVRQALKELEGDGLLQRKRGSGTFVAKVPEKPSRLKIMRRCVIGIVLSGVDFNMNVTVGGIVMELYKHIEKAGYLAILINEDISPLREMDVAGVITVNQVPNALAKDLLGLSIPLVSCSICEKSFTRNNVDFEHAASLLVETFVGHKHLAIFGEGDDAVQVSGCFLKNLEKECVGSEMLLSDCVAKKDGAKKLEKLLSSTNPPDAIFLTNSWSAQSLFDVCAKLSLKIPEDISVIVHGYNAIALATTPPLSLIYLDMAQNSKKMISLLLDMIANNKTCKQKSSKYILQIRSSIQK